MPLTFIPHRLCFSRRLSGKIPYQKERSEKILLQTKIERKDNGIKSESICVNVEMATLYS